MVLGADKMDEGPFQPSHHGPDHAAHHVRGYQGRCGVDAWAGAGKEGGVILDVPGLQGAHTLRGTAAFVSPPRPTAPPAIT